MAPGSEAPKVGVAAGLGFRPLTAHWVMSEPSRTVSPGAVHVEALRIARWWRCYCSTPRAPLELEEGVDQVLYFDVVEGGAPATNTDRTGPPTHFIRSTMWTPRLMAAPPSMAQVRARAIGVQAVRYHSRRRRTALGDRSLCR